MAYTVTDFIVTKGDGSQITLPYPQEYEPQIYDVDAPTTGRNAAGTMIRDRVAVKHKFNCKWAALDQDTLIKIINACSESSFLLTIPDFRTGMQGTYRVYVGDRSAPVYWYPSNDPATWMYASLSMNFIEM